MIDFTNLQRKNKMYAGANGSKISVMYNNEQYMVKFPPHPSRNGRISYTNSCISEYIGSHIFNMVGIKAQETLLGTYNQNGKEKIVVACKDFTTPNLVLQDFASLKNTIIDSEHNGYGTELSDIMYTIEEQQIMPASELKKFFWNMFVVDALLGNWDRHNGNWGFLYNPMTDEMHLAPVYDCGSCLYPQADEKIMKLTLTDQAEKDLRIYEIPLSGIRVDGQKIRYYDFMHSLKDKDCNKALKRMARKINMADISKMINNIPCISELQKRFYIEMLAARKEKIIDEPFKLLKRKERDER